MTEASSPSKAVVSFLFSNVFECAICGARGPREMFDIHHISYDPEITVMLCASCHAIITRNRLSPEAQLQIQWANENLKLVIKAYMRKIAKLKAQINELEKLKRGLQEPIKEYIVKQASSHEELKQLLEQGYEVVGGLDIKFLKKRVPIPWRLKA